MLAAASQVVVNNRGMQYRTGNPEYVLFSFPLDVKFAKSFPKGFRVEQTAERVVHKINAVKLLDWLYNTGRSKYDSKMLVKNTRAFEVLTNSIDRIFQGDLI